jgi:mRNA-degrading endonuclease RelE of RelBE toxin-antitoxin system
VLAKRARFSLVVSAAAREELDALRVFEKRQISDAIEVNLLVDPLAETRKMKKLGDVKAGFTYDRPLRELKVGAYRVYYNVDEQALMVMCMPFVTSRRI